jgi:hypothetical protein
MGQGCDFVMSERGNPVAGCSLLSVLMSLLGVLQGLPRLFGSCKVLRLSLLLGYTMSMRRPVV